MAIKHSLLGLLTKTPQTGYRLHRTLSAQLAGLWQVTEAQVYATLERMAAEGLVQRRSDESGSARPKKAYSITEAGGEAFARWLIAPVTKHRGLQNEFALKLLFAGDDPDRLTQMIAGQRDQLAGLLSTVQARMREASDEQPRAEARQLVLQSALLNIESQLSWLELVERQLLRKDQKRQKGAS